jgi:tryptophan 2,3-dioxygenase
VYTALVQTLQSPSLWDDVLTVLARRGFAIPGQLRDRDYSVEHEPSGAVEAAWVEVYRSPGPDNHLRMLGEALTEVAEQFGEWRHRHLSTVRRTMGTKAGSGGSAGEAWLRRSMARPVFPELWSARTLM